MKILHAAIIAAALSVIPILAQSQEHQHATPQQRQSPPTTMMSPGMMQGGMTGPQQNRSGFGNLKIDRVEGRLAFLKTELRISDAQLPAWTVFAEAVRTNATTMQAEHRYMHGRVGSDVALPDRLAAQANAFAAHAEEMAKLKAALDPLYAGFSAEQKKTADEIVFSPMGVPIGPM